MNFLLENKPVHPLCHDICYILLTSSSIFDYQWAEYYSSSGKIHSLLMILGIIQRGRDVRFSREYDRRTKSKSSWRILSTSKYNCFSLNLLGSIPTLLICKQRTAEIVFVKISFTEVSSTHISNTYIIRDSSDRISSGGIYSNKESIQYFLVFY